MGFWQKAEDSQVTSKVICVIDSTAVWHQCLSQFSLPNPAVMKTVDREKRGNLFPLTAQQQVCLLSVPEGGIFSSLQVSCCKYSPLENCLGGEQPSVTHAHTHTCTQTHIGELVVQAYKGPLWSWGYLFLIIILSFFCYPYFEGMLLCMHTDF